MNTRLQVEHPVTEMVVGVDLVEMMIRVAAGERLPAHLANISIDGHAIETRILAEDAAGGFTPQIGVVHQVRQPAGARWDSAVEPGSEISPFYDSMIAKLVVHGNDRVDALAQMRTALDRLVIDGVTTTAGFHRWLFDQQPIIDGRVTTRFLDETQIPAPAESDAITASKHAAVAWVRAQQAVVSSPWVGSSFSVTPHQMKHNIGLVAADDSVEEIALTADQARLELNDNVAVDRAGRRVAVNLHGHTYSFAVPSRTERWAPSIATRKATGDAIVAPFPAVVSEVLVSAGQGVEGDQVLVIIEAMKMLHSLRASGAATIDSVRVRPGDQIATGDVLVSFAPSDEDLSNYPTNPTPQG